MRGLSFLIVFSVVAVWIAELCCIEAGTYPRGSGTQAFDYPDGTTQLDDGSEIGSTRIGVVNPALAQVLNRSLLLANKEVREQVASFRLPPLDGTSVMKSFDLNFTIAMNKPDHGDAGEGWSVNFGQLPMDHGTGEGGFAPLPRGLTVDFDLLDETLGGSSIGISVGGVELARFGRSLIYGMLFRPVSIHWDELGLDVSYDGKPVCTDLGLQGFSPASGDQFAFSARTTSRSMDVAIDNLRVVTQVVPPIETGGPVISEMVAVNGDFEDEFAETPSWIELLNGSAASVDLTGWFLTDSRANLTRWKIPGLTLSPFNYQVIFASGRDRALSSNSFLHAGFKLSREGGFVALVQPDGKTIQSALEYGPQERGASFGEQGSNRARGFMSPPSPGAVNGSIPQSKSFGPEVIFSHPGGLVASLPILVLETEPLPGVEIRFTTDRTEPGRESARYSGPVPLSRLTMVRARTYVPGHLPGRISSRTFVPMDDTLTNFNGSGKVFDSNLPVLYLDSFGFGVDGSSGGSSPFRPVYAIVISPDSSTGRASLTGTPDYAGPAGAHVRGESSSGFDQRSYAIEIRDEAGLDFDVALAGMPAESDWILYGPWSEKTMMRNKLVFDWMRHMRGADGTSMRTRFVELFFNQSPTSNGRVGYGSYRGVYVLMEKIKRGRDRVPLKNLNSKTTDPSLVSGGYIFRKDKDDPVKTKWTTPRFSMPLQSFDPDQINPVQLGSLRGYLNAFETALAGSNLRDPVVGYRAFLDADTFIDAQWMVEVSKQVDGYVFSTYFHKDRDRRLRAGPLWDFNISLGNADYATGDRPTGWLYDIPGGVGQNWYPRLHNDPDYRVAHWDRYWELRNGLLSQQRVFEAIDQNARVLLDGYQGVVSNRAPASIQNPVARHYRKWPRLGLRDWPNPGITTSLRTWQSEVAYLKNWVSNRLSWLDDQSLRSGNLVYRPPHASRVGGVYSSADSVTWTPFQQSMPLTQYPQGIVYFTTDGSDPRLPGGQISGAAKKYVEPIVVDRSMTMKARTLAPNNVWSPLAVEVYLFDVEAASPSNVVVSEILFEPMGPSASELRAGLSDASQFEFLEMMNISKRTVDLKDVVFSRGIDFSFAHIRADARYLGPGESKVLVSDRRAFEFRYPRVHVSRILGQFTGQLDNGGETLGWGEARGRWTQEFRYNDSGGWPGTSGGSGKSYVLRAPRSSPVLSEPKNWTASFSSGGNPGVSGDGAELFQGDPRADRDEDGVIDLLEFYAGTDMEDPASASPIEVELVRTGSEGAQTGVYLGLRVRRNPVVKGLRSEWEFSEDLVRWSSAGDGVVLVASELGANGLATDRYRMVDSIGDESAKARRFLRFRVFLN